MNWSNFLQFILLNVCLTLGTTSYCQIPQDLSEAELLSLQEEINKEIEKEVAKMSPEEQETFFTVMSNIEELAEKDPATLERFISGQMSKEEEEAFVNAMVPAEVTSKKEEVVEPIAPAKEEVKVEKPKVPTKKQESARDLIDGLIKETEAFLVKIETIPDASLKIASWGQKRKIKNWKSGYTWESIRDEINNLLRKLRLIKEGISNNKLVYIDEIAKNESLINNLSKVKAVFDQYMPEIRIAPFATKSLDKKARTAVQEIIGIEIEAIRILDIPKELDNIFSKSEPELKLLSEKEEAARKEAEKNAQQPRNRATLQTAGKEIKQERVPSYGTDNDYQRSGYSGGYSPPYSPSSYSPSYGYGAPSQQSYSDQRRGSSPSPRAAKQEAAFKDNAAEKDEKTNLTGKTKSSPVAPKQEKKDLVNKFDRNERQLNKIADLLDETLTMIDQAEYLPNLRKHLLNDSQGADDRLAKTTMPAIHQSIILATEAVKAFITRIKDEKEKDRYKKDLKEMYKPYKKKLNEVADEAKAIRNLAIKTTPDKQAAYLEGPSSINELENAIENLNKTIEKA